VTSLSDKVAISVDSLLDGSRFGVFHCGLCEIEDVRPWPESNCQSDNSAIADHCLARWSAVPAGVLVVFEDELL
jgi:hypothetical protein